MSTPTKPERVEVGMQFATKYDPFTVTRYNGETDWAVKWDDGLLIGCPENNKGDDGDTFAGYCAEFEATLLAPAPATPGTATVTPAEPCCTECVLRPNHAGACIPAKASAKVASKPPASPVYGRMVGELRAPDGTPRTALEAIRAKREPEPWVESCDPLHWLRDA